MATKSVAEEVSPLRARPAPEVTTRCTEFSDANDTGYPMYAVCSDIPVQLALHEARALAAAVDDLAAISMVTGEPIRPNVLALIQFAAQAIGALVESVTAGMEVAS